MSLLVHFATARDDSRGGTGLPTRVLRATGRETRATLVVASPHWEEPGLSQLH